LYVPYGQTFIVNHLASLSIDPSATSQEGPADLGLFPVQEVRVAGTMQIETSRENPTDGKKGVNATITIDPTGSCIVEDGATLTISSGQMIYILAGGELILETGGEIIIEDGGYLTVFGNFNHAGTLTLEDGSTTIFGPNSSVLLAADLNIAAGATFMGSSGCTITASSTDAEGTGYDTDLVEIICDGVVSFLGSSNSPLAIQGQSSGIGNWAGIRFSSDETAACQFNFVSISDADVGINVISSSAPLNLWNLSISQCEKGVSIQGRNDITLLGTEYGGEISECTYGVDLHADIDVDGISIHDNAVGIKVFWSHPRVRNCLIYGNNIGVYTTDPNASPDLGTMSDPGNNDFGGSGDPNTVHIISIDPYSTIYAQQNWWGTKKKQLIEQKILVYDDPTTSWLGDVLFEPFLLEAPGGGVQQTAIRPESEEPSVPSATYLEQNFPNPFNPTTTISFGLEKGSEVSLRIYDAAGHLVRILHDGHLEAGIHTQMWNGNDSHGNSVASGVYFYNLKTSQFKETRKMILLR